MFLQKPMLGTQIDWSNPINDGLVLDLLFNEGHGNRVNDLSGWGNHGTLHGFDFPPTVASSWNPGMDGVGLNFDGADDYIRVPNSPSLNPTAATIDVVVKAAPYGDTHERFLICKGSQKYGIERYYDNWRGVLTDASGGGYPCAVPAINGMWQRLTFTAVSDGMAYMYLNGVVSPNAYSVDGFIQTDEHPLWIGAYAINPTLSHNFNSLVARARILNRAMSAFEVMQTQINPYGVYQQ